MRLGLRITTIGCALAAATAAVACGAARTPTTAAGTLSPTSSSARTASRVDTFRVAMPELGGRTRTVRVYLPKGYDGGSARYPVLYLQDAQQLFTAGWFGDWLVDETVDRMTDAGTTRGLIVVGVDNGERQRWDEYGPWANHEMRRWIPASWARPVEGGEGDAYVRFLVRTLKPAIDRRYRTRPERASTAIGGSSMGGLIALHAGLARPDVFSKVLAMSPAVWFAEGDSVWLRDNRLVAEARRAPRTVRFYVDVGTNERSRDTEPDVVDARGAAVPYPRAYEEGARATVAALRAAGVPDENVRLVVDTGAEHGERAWSRRLPGALEWLFR